MKRWIGLLESLYYQTSPVFSQKRWIVTTALAFMSVGLHSAEQSTAQITFEGPPPQPPGSSYSIRTYSELGVLFTPLAPQTSFSRVGVGFPGDPQNGTTYVRAAFAESMTFSFQNGSFLNLISVDLAEYSTGFSEPLIVPFIGYRQDGSSVQTSFMTDGLIDGTGRLADFQTFYFGSEFSNLTRVEIPAWGWSLDNLVVAVPEAGTYALLILGIGMAAIWRFKRRGHEPAA